MISNLTELIGKSQSFIRLNKKDYSFKNIIYNSRRGVGEFPPHQREVLMIPTHNEPDGRSAARLYINRTIKGGGCSQLFFFGA
jgi:hypothetical protein